MARSIASIKAQIITNIQSNVVLYDPSNPDPTKRGLTSTSLVALWNLWCYITAAAFNLLEQIIDIYKSIFETTISQQPIGQARWIQQQILKFQYGNIIQLVNNVYQYIIPNLAAQIVTQCAVTTIQNGQVTIKVSSNNAPLTAPQLQALQSYYFQLGIVGIIPKWVNSYPDYIMVGADIYYDGQYSATIVSTVQAAIINFVTNLPFNGIIKLSDLEIVIRNVPGVNDCDFSQVEARANTIPVLNASKLVNNYQEMFPNYYPFSGYFIIDTAVGRGLANTLNFIAQ